MLLSLCSKHRRRIGLWSCILAALAVLAFLAPDIAFAADGKPTFEDIIGDVASTIVKYISIFIWIFLGFIGHLMDPNEILQPDMVAMLRNIWIVVRNITNIGFAIVLLGASFYVVIFGGGDGGVSVKGALPRFILGLILVNFSWLGCRVVLDVANVATAAVFAIPQSIAVTEPRCRDIFETVDKKDPNNPTPATEIGESGRCYGLSYIDISSEAKLFNKEGEVKTATDGSALRSVAPAERRFKGQTKKKVARVVQYGDVFEMGYHELERGDFKASNAAMILGANLMSIQNLSLVSRNTRDRSTFTINLIFSLFFILVFAIPILVLFIVLLARMVVLWLCMAFMPLAFLGLLIQGSLTTSFIEGMPDIVDQFIKNAFLPVYVAAPLSVGFLMINTAQVLTASGSQTTLGDTVLNVNPLIAGIGDTQAILWYIAAAGIVWMGTFTALKGNQITESIVNTIQDKAEGFGKFVATSPKYLPFIPVYQGQDAQGKPTAYSLSSLSRLPQLIQSRLEGRSHEEAQSFGRSVLPGFFKGESQSLGTDQKYFTGLRGKIDSGDGEEHERRADERLRKALEAAKDKPNDKVIAREVVEATRQFANLGKVKATDRSSNEQIESIVRLAYGAESLEYKAYQAMDKAQKISAQVRGGSVSDTSDKDKGAPTPPSSQPVRVDKDTITINIGGGVKPLPVSIQAINENKGNDAGEVRKLLQSIKDPARRKSILDDINKHLTDDGKAHINPDQSAGG